MRCYCCNNILTTPESVRKFKLSNTPTEMCDGCLKEIDVPTVEGVVVDEEEAFNEGDEE